MRRVGDVADLTNGYPFDSDAFGTDGMPLVRIRDLFLGKFATYVSGPVPNAVVLKNGDIVIGMDGDFELVVWKRGPAALNQRMCMLRARPGTDSRFLAYALPRHLKVINDLTYATTVKHLSSFDVLAERIAVPPPSHQRAIADYLDAETARIDEVLRTLRRAVDLLDIRRRSLICAAVASGSAQGRRTRLRYVVTAQTGAWGDEQGVQPLDAYCVRAADFDRTHLRVVRDSPPTRSFRQADFETLRLHRGDIVLEKSGGGPGQPVGGSVLFDLDVPAVCSNFAVRLRPSPEVHPGYLVYQLAALYWQGHTEALAKQTTGIANLDVGAYLGTELYLPSYHDQRELSTSLDIQLRRLDQLHAARRRQIELLLERRQALITAAVTGQLKIAGVAA